MSRKMPGTMASRSFQHNFMEEPAWLQPLNEDTRLRAVLTYADAIWQDRVAANCDESTYTGGPGVAVAYLYSCKDIERARDFLLRPMRGVQEEEKWLDKRRRSRDAELATSLLCGRAGNLFAELYLACTAAAEHHAGALVQRLCAEYLAVRTQDCSSDEWLYGRTGYLWGLLWMKRTLRTSVPGVDEKIQSVTREILRSGQAMASSARRQGLQGPPLMYTWYNEAYLGAAHGLAGIYYMLLCCIAHLDVSAVTDLRESIDWLLSECKLQPSGNYAAVVGERSDLLLHFCHGAPGFIFLFLKAHEVWGADAYRQEALDLGGLVFSHGLLKKGPGLCHGIAGNGFCLLALYRATRDETWLLRAHAFARAILDLEGKGHSNVCRPLNGRYPRQPDRPLSLFEGVAGTMCFFAALAQPDAHLFPMFEA